MKHFTYDQEAGTLYIEFIKAISHKSEEVQDGIIVEYNEVGTVIGLQIINFLKQGIRLNYLIDLDDEDIISMFVKK